MKRFRIKRNVAKKMIERLDVTCVCGCDHVDAIIVDKKLQITVRMDDCTCPNRDDIEHTAKLKDEVKH